MSSLPQGPLWVVGGPPGAGKSSAARAIIRQLKTPIALLDKDTVYGDVVSSVLRSRGVGVEAMNGAWYDEYLKPAEYRGLFRTAAEIRANGTGVLLCAPFTTYARDAASWQELQAASGGGTARLWWVHVAPETLRRRMAERGELRNQSDLDDFDAFLGRVEPERRPVVPHTIIRNDNEGLDALQDAVASALARMGSSLL